MGATVKTRAVVVLGSKASPEESLHKDNCARARELKPLLKSKENHTSE